MDCRATDHNPPHSLPEYKAFSAMPVKLSVRSRSSRVAMKLSAPLGKHRFPDAASTLKRPGEAGNRWQALDDARLDDLGIARFPRECLVDVGLPAVDATGGSPVSRSRLCARLGLACQDLIVI